MHQNRARSESLLTNNREPTPPSINRPPPINRPPSAAHPRTNFRQHLFNNIFKTKCSNAFTAKGIMDHPFEHFVKELPVKVNELIGKFFEKVTPFLGHLLTVVRDLICLVFLKDSNMAKSYYFLFVLIFFLFHKRSH
jgi:hypothetical protein